MEMDYELNILYYIDIYKKWWRRIVAVAGISMFLTMLFSMTRPATYVSTVTLLSAGGESSASSFAEKVLGFSSAQSSSNSVIIAILQSRRMAKGIDEKFNLSKRPDFRYKIITGEMIGGLTITVKGTDPELTQKIANFITEDNLVKIRDDLDITTVKKMATVLDPATYGKRRSRETLRKMFVAGLLASIITSLYAFFSDYLKRLKR
jgi:uncharacterized protein involved in exopolysaccharide biosynthesis